MQIRFASKINIEMDYGKFDQLCKAEPGPESTYPWTEATRVKSPTNAWTDGASSCNAGGLTNPEGVMLFHYYTRDWWWNEKGDLVTDDTYRKHLEPSIMLNTQSLPPIIPKLFRKAIEDDCAEMRARNPHIRALITGGRAGNDIPSSGHLKRFLIETFQALKIPFSVVWGGPGTGVHYSREKDTWTITPTNPLRPQDPNESDADYAKTLYQEIQIAPGDTLHLNNTPIEVKP